MVERNYLRNDGVALGFYENFVHETLKGPMINI